MVVEVFAFTRHVVLAAFGMVDGYIVYGAVEEPELLVLNSAFVVITLLF